MIKPKDILLVQFPFTDQAASKIRPCLVLATSPSFFLAMPITSINSREILDDFIYQLSKNDTTFPMDKTSCVRCNIVMTFAHSYIVKHLTKMHDEAFERVKDLYKQMEGID